MSKAIELHLTVIPAAVKRVEIGPVIDAKDNRFPIDHELLRPVTVGALHSVRPVIAVAGEKPDQTSVANHDQSITVVFNFVNPVRAGRDLGPPGGDVGLKL